MEEQVDYYLNAAGLIVFTAHYHLQRGYCCGNGCRHCPWKTGKYESHLIQKEKEKMLKETKSPRYESAFHEALVNVSHTHNWSNDKVKVAVAPYDITSQQFNVLRILRGQFPNPSTINLIKSRMLDKMCDASRIVDRLVQKNLVIKNISNYDKRAVDILINDKGLGLLKKMDEEVNLSAVFSAHISAEEARELTRLLEKARGKS